MSVQRGVWVLSLLTAIGLGLTPPAMADASPTVIAIKNGKFVPDEVSVPAGQKVELLVRNEDKTTSEFESSDFHREQIVQPGNQITVYVGPLDAGTYVFFDDFHPDNRGRLVVK